MATGLHLPLRGNGRTSNASPHLAQKRLVNDHMVDRQPEVGHLAWRDIDTVVVYSQNRHGRASHHLDVVSDQISTTTQWQLASSDSNLAITVEGSGRHTATRLPDGAIVNIGDRWGDFLFDIGNDIFVSSVRSSIFAYDLNSSDAIHSDKRGLPFEPNAIVWHGNDILAQSYSDIFLLHPRGATIHQTKAIDFPGWQGLTDHNSLRKWKIFSSISAPLFHQSSGVSYSFKSSQPGFHREWFSLQPGGNFMAALELVDGDGNCHLYLYNTQTKTKVSILENSNKDVFLLEISVDVVWSEDGRYLYYFCGSIVGCWDTTSNHSVWVLRHPDPGYLYCFIKDRPGTSDILLGQWNFSNHVSHGDPLVADIIVLDGTTGQYLVKSEVPVDQFLFGRSGAEIDYPGKGLVLIPDGNHLIGPEGMIEIRHPGEVIRHPTGSWRRPSPDGRWLITTNDWSDIRFSDTVGAGLEIIVESPPEMTKRGQSPRIVWHPDNLRCVLIWKEPFVFDVYPFAPGSFDHIHQALATLDTNDWPRAVGWLSSPEVAEAPDKILQQLITRDVDARSVLVIEHLAKNGYQPAHDLLNKLAGTDTPLARLAADSCTILGGKPVFPPTPIVPDPHLDQAAHQATGHTEDDINADTHPGLRNVTPGKSSQHQEVDF